MCDYGTMKVRKARKRYWCCACFTQIDVGDEYWHVKGYSDIIQSFYAERHCMACKAFYDARKAQGKPICFGPDMARHFDKASNKRRRLAFKKGKMG